MKQITAVLLLLLVSFAPVQAQLPDPTPLPLYALPDGRERTFTSSSIALSSDGRTLVAVNMLNDTISFVNVFIPSTAELLGEITVGPDPRSVAITPDNSLALIVQRGDSTLAVVDIAAQTVLETIPLGGALPYGVVTDRNDRAFVSLQGTGEIVAVDLEAGQVDYRIQVADFPAGLALWSEFLYITHFWSGDVSLIYLPESRVIETVPVGGRTGVSQAIEIDASRGIAYLPQTRMNILNTALLFDTTVFPVVNVLNLRGLTTQPRARIDLSTADRPVNMPFDVALDRFRNWLFVANAGSNDVSVIDLASGLARANIPVRANPRGLLLNNDNTFLFVHNAIDGSLSIVETTRLTVIDVLPISNPRISTEIIIGAELFHSAADPRLSEDRWLSCATCHFDGLPDGRTWLGLGDGARNTPPLFNLIETAPYNWSATWDEIHDVDFKIRRLMGGSGLIEDFPISDPQGQPNADLSFELDLLVDYLLSLDTPSNPEMFDQAIIEEGEQVFEAQGCDTCHMSAAGTDLRTHDVGTGDPDSERRGTAFDTPTLRHLWLSAPYFHDGSAPTLMDVFLMPGEHNLTEDVPIAGIEALVAYLLSWPAE